jgi:hypothetical protein
MCEPFTLACDNGHVKNLTATELEDLIDSGEFGCTECNRPLAFDDPTRVTLECHVCSMTFEVTSLDEANATMYLGCQGCEGRGFDGQSIHVPRSFYYRSAQYEWMRSGREQAPLRRPGRTDYWEGVIHFCDAEEFASIQRDGRIEARPTGKFKLPAVCLSEATEGGWEELRKQHGQFGFIFHKRDILALGGGPALYLPDALITAQDAIGFADVVKPFVTLLRTGANAPGRKRHDYLFEREWRIPNDIVFGHLPPYAVISGAFDETTLGWDDIYTALMIYEEIEVEEKENNA